MGCPGHVAVGGEAFMKFRKSIEFAVIISLGILILSGNAQTQKLRRARIAFSFQGHRDKDNSGIYTIEPDGSDPAAPLDY